MTYNKIYAVIGEERHIVLDPINYQYDVKQILVLTGETVPDYYEADVCNVGDTATLTMIGTAADGVEIPDKFLLDGRNVLVYVVIPGSGGDVQTRYDITIPVDERAEREDIDPSEAEQQQIDSLINALNSGVGRAETAATAAEESATDAEGSAGEAEEKAENAEAWAVGQRAGEDVPDTDPTYHNNSKYYAGMAEAAAEEAGQHEASWETWVQRAESAADDAEGSARAAAGAKADAEAAAQTATQKATEAGNSADAAAGSAASARQTVDGAIGAINTAKEGALTAIGSAGSNAVGAVEQAGTTQTGRVTSEGNTQVNRVQAKGDEVLDSIPQDYSDLVDDVADLNRQLSESTDALFGLMDYTRQARFDFFDGEIHSGTWQADSRRCYSELFDNMFGKNIYFDDTKYKVLLVFFSNDESSHTYGSWVSASPAASSTLPTSYPKMRVEVQTKDDSDIDKYRVAATTYYIDNISNKNVEVRYVSTNGSDNNDGSKTSPFATVNKALESGAKIVYLATGRYFQQIDLSKAINGVVDLRKSENGNVYFSPVNDRKIVTSASLVSGKTKTYQATISVTLNADNRWLYQEEVEDASTAITETERLPQERGLTYRCANTLIKKCTSGNKTDAIAEIEASGEYLWYLDGTTLYFSCPSAVSGSNPISYSDGSKLFINNSRDVAIRMEGILCEFVAINLDYSVGSVIRDCSAGYVFGAGAITYDYAQAVQIIRCEALRCNNGNQGDGINGHADTSSGGIKTRRTTALIIDCWCHDNRDDGFSDHGGCESTIIGGLFEYNGKGGVTPSYGSHCTAHDVISRYNYNGFYYTGQASDGGISGELECFSCIAENNLGGSSQVNAGFLMDSNGDSMTLVGCKSVGNKIGYYAPSGTLMRLYECTALDCEQSAAGKVRMTIKNGTLIEP